MEWIFIAFSCDISSNVFRISLVYIHTRYPPLLFLSFFGFFFFSSLVKWEFSGGWKNKYRRKIWEKEEEDVGAAGVCSEEGFFGIFLGLFFVVLEEEEDNL